MTPRRLFALLLACSSLSGCALPFAHARRNLHFARYRLMPGQWKMDCGDAGGASFCVYRARSPAEEDPRAAIYFFHYATGDAKSLARLGLANALYRAYRRARAPIPRLISVSYGSHWLFSDRPGKRQTVSTSEFLSGTLPLLEKKLGIPARRYLWGMSQGGYNALQLALARPADWKATAASCPALYAVDPFGGQAHAVADRTKAPPSWVIDGMALFNSRLQDAAAWAAEDPVARAKTAAAPPILIQANLGDEFGFFEGAKALEGALKSRGGSVSFQAEKGGHCVNDVSKVAAFFLSNP